MMLLAFNLASVTSLTSVTSVTSVSANAGTRRSISTNDAGRGRGHDRGHDAHLDAHLDVDIDEDGRVHNMVHESTSKSPLAKLRRVLFHHQIQNHMHGNMNVNGNMNGNMNGNGNGSANKAGNGNRRYKHNHGQHSIMSTCRTRIMFALPTPEQLFDIMFASSSFDHQRHHGTQHPTSSSTSRSANSNSNSKGSVLQSKSKSQLQFNHDSVGMTKPPPMDMFMSSLSSDTSSSLSTTTTTKNTCTMNIPSTTIGNNDTPTDIDHDHTSTDSIDHTTLRVWWPSTSTSTSITSTRTCMDTDAADKTTSTWRVKRYTRRVGVGRHCYNLVRDAALDWEFQSTSTSASASASACSSTGNGDVDVDRMGRMNTGSMYRREATQMDAIRNVNTRYRSGDGNPIILERGTGALSDTDQGDPMPMPVTGIIRATPSRTTSSSTQYQSQYQSSPITENTNPDILQIWSGIGTGPNYTATVNAHKKLATFTRFGFEFKLPHIPVPRPAFLNRLSLSLLQFQLPSLPLPLSLGSRLRSLRLPSIYLYAINPVAVVYDVVDERGDFNANGNVNVNVNTDNYGHRGFARGHGHAGCTYSSTAYATLQGHLLSGEERVSVILRHGENHRDGDGDGSPHSNSKPGHAQSQDQDQDGFVDVEIISFSKAAPSLFGKIVWPFIAKKQDEFFKSEMDALERVAKKSCCVP
jgi:uncharacterized protein (UPF0548 family)